jgi:RNA polymerase sigma-70 factor (ECF subfamily)
MARPGQDLETLLPAAAGGDAWAMTCVLEEIRPALVRFVARHLDRRVAVRVDPADVVQEVLVMAVARVGAFIERHPLPFDAWVKGIAAERIACAHRVHIRSKRRTVCREAGQGWRGETSLSRVLLGSALSAEPPPDAWLEMEERRADVKQRIEQLPIEEQELLRLRFFENVGAKVVAEQLGITAAAVRMRQVRALRHLRALLAQTKQTH